MRILIEYILLLCLIIITMAEEQTDIQALRAVSDGTNQFSSALFQAVIEQNSGNIIMSPLSASVVLAMAAYGARGETENQFKKVLHLPSPDSFSQLGYQKLIDNMNDVKQNTLLLANKVFVAQKFSIKPTYKHLTESYFRSASQLVNFAKSTEAANTINTWVQQNTNNRIDSIVNPDDLNEMTALVLVNAVYFKGQWKNKFRPEATQDMPFHINENTVKNVPTMYRRGSYKFGNLPELNARFIEIPYKGDELSMIIILPNEINGLSVVEKKLQSISITDILNKGFEREIELYLPKFKIEKKIELNEILKKLGLTDMFTSKANFSGMADSDLLVSKVVQKAFIEVNEEGSEAAAVTGIGFVGASLQIGPPPSEFKIDRPFIYITVKKCNNKESNNESLANALFMGHVNEPQIGK